VSAAAAVAGASLLLALILMLVELRVSQANERTFRHEGAVDAPDPVYGTMRWAYPGIFVAMAAEGALWGPSPGWTTGLGVLLFATSKALKAWAIATLGTRWTYKVLVRPGVPLVTAGPYAWVRHPNYVAVVGEMIGMAMLVGAVVTGPVGTACFGLLLRRRIVAEERALGLRAAAG
jgi:methyltransferase